MICAKTSRMTVLSLSEHPLPVPVHAHEQRLVVQQLRRPFDGVNLRDFGRDYQTCHLKELLGGDIPIADDPLRVCRISKARIRVRRLRRLSVETIDELVVLSGEDVVQEAQADRPVVREPGGLLTAPVGKLRIGVGQHGADSPGDRPRSFVRQLEPSTAGQNPVDPA